MLEVGSVSKKNTKNILVKNIFDACIAAMMWWAVGSSLAGSGGDDFTDDGSNGMAGKNAFFLETSTAGKSAYSKAGWFFGWTFAGAGCTIVSGAIAERATFLAYCLYSIVLTGFVYPPVVHMMWSTTGKFSAWRSPGDDGDSVRLFGDRRRPGVVPIGLWPFWPPKPEEHLRDSREAPKPTHHESRRSSAIPNNSYNANNSADDTRGHIRKNDSFNE